MRCQLHIQHKQYECERHQRQPCPVRSKRSCPEQEEDQGNASCNARYNSARMRNLYEDAYHSDNEQQEDHVRVDQEGVERINGTWLDILNCNSCRMQCYRMPRIQRDHAPIDFVEQVTQTRCAITCRVVHIRQR